MAKMSMVKREEKRTKLVARFSEKRTALKMLIKNPETPFDEKMAAVDKLQKLPRDSSPVRQHNRCKITGRPHGYYRKFGFIDDGEL